MQQQIANLSAPLPGPCTPTPQCCPQGPGAHPVILRANSPATPGTIQDTLPPALPVQRIPNPHVCNASSTAVQQRVEYTLPLRCDKCYIHVVWVCFTLVLFWSYYLYPSNPLLPGLPLVLQGYSGNASGPSGAPMPPPGSMYSGPPGGSGAKPPTSSGPPGPPTSREAPPGGPPGPHPAQRPPSGYPGPFGGPPGPRPPGPMYPGKL